MNQEVLVGSCPDSWGVWFADDPHQTPWRRFLDEVATAGYSLIELGPYGYLPTQEKQLQAELEHRGLSVYASAVSADLEGDDTALAKLQEQALQVGQLLQSFGARYLVVIDEPYRDIRTGEFRGPRTLGPSEWQRLVRTCTDLGRMVQAEFGLRLLVHPHADSHVESTEQVNALLSDTDPGVVDLCLDLGHFEYSGGDSLALLRQSRDRIPYIHVKMVDPGVLQAVSKADLPFAEAVRKGVFTEPELGRPDLEQFAKLLGELHFQGCLMVEQDMYPCDPETPLPIAIRTRDQLHRAGLG